MNLKISLFLIFIFFIIIVIAIVGNKSDLDEDPKFSENEVEEYAKDNGLLFSAISAQNGIGIEELFINIGNELVKQEEEDKSPRNSINDKNNIDNKNDGKNNNITDDKNDDDLKEKNEALKRRNSIKINGKDDAKKINCC